MGNILKRLSCNRSLHMYSVYFNVSLYIKFGGGGWVVGGMEFTPLPVRILYP